MEREREKRERNRQEKGREIQESVHSYGREILGGPRMSMVGVVGARCSAVIGCYSFLLEDV